MRTSGRLYSRQNPGLLLPALPAALHVHPLKFDVPCAIAGVASKEDMDIAMREKQWQMKPSGLLEFFCGILMVPPFVCEVWMSLNCQAVKQSGTLFIGMSRWVSCPTLTFPPLSLSQSLSRVERLSDTTVGSSQQLHPYLPR
ncbi:hypothetical protein RvY_17502 [Ramazzottius varieornatus]|uniref:Uncharacterized protein n=1 Tax=Ramazzottius varieornatus TaxID=947166 RepID=A0A1D1W2Q3_RAMVA|nr:hypothetical protein RvY_17502 [Ramazzottius varieornatus]